MRGAVERAWRERRQQAAEDRRKLRERIGLATGVPEELLPKEESVEELYTVPVRGFRRFQIGYSEPEDGKRYGWLTGCSYKEPWDIGTNVSKCAKDQHRVIKDLRWDWERTRWVDSGEPHSIGPCTCGFYAVYDPFHAARGPVSGMIEGWGEVIAGPDGFRCSKAKIVALAMPPLPKPHHTRVQITDQWCVIPTKYLPGHIKETVDREVDDVVNVGLRKAYQSVPIFDNEAEMLAEFPPEKGEVPVEPEEEYVIETWGGQQIRWYSQPAYASISSGTSWVSYTCPNCARQVSGTHVCEGA